MTKEGTDSCAMSVGETSAAAGPVRLLSSGCQRRRRLEHDDDRDGRPSVPLPLCVVFICLAGSPSPVQADEFPAHQRCQVIGRDALG
jgi:hypothetical protein